MDNYHAQLLHESNKRLIEALGMHWDNEVCKMAKSTPIYCGEDFSMLAHKALEL